MTYTALAIVFMLVSIGVGARSAGATGPRFAIALAAVMVAAQLALLMSS
jgi:hypothetical protein